MEKLWIHINMFEVREVRTNECNHSARSGGIIVRNPGRDISFPIFIRNEIETRNLERKSKQKISRLIDLFYHLNDIISR